MFLFFFFFQAEDGIRDYKVTGVQTCALPIWARAGRAAGLPDRVDRPQPLVSAAASRPGPPAPLGGRRGDAALGAGPGGRGYGPAAARPSAGLAGRGRPRELVGAGAGGPVAAARPPPPASIVGPASTRPQRRRAGGVR